MKALVYTQYGSPDVLQLKEIAKPTPKDNEVLVKVHAASVNPGDLYMVRGMGRFMGNGLLKPKNQIPGSDIAGRVEAVGSHIKQLKPGDKVFGDISGSGGGGFADYVAVPEDTLALKPASLTFEEAAAVPLAAVTALHGLRDKGQIQAGQMVLINGASGGVGTFAVQIAKAFGAEVTAVCSTGKMEMARSLGAGRIIDYTQEDFTQNGECYDLIFDTVGNRSISEYKHALQPTGVFVTTAFLPALVFLGPWLSMTGRQKMSNMISKPNLRNLALIKELLDTGQVVPVIDRRYPLSEVPEAFRYLGKGHAKGKVVITSYSEVESNGHQL